MMIPRLYCEQPLFADGEVVLTDAQIHYLRAVLRAEPGQRLAVFNGHDGEWSAVLAELSKRGGRARVEQRLRPQSDGPDIWLLFAPLKKDPLDVLVQKAVELGVSRLLPVLTAYTDVTRVNIDRLRAQAMEAAEQCERLQVPEVADPVRLDEVLAAWPAERALYVCAEAGPTRPFTESLLSADDRPAAILIGPAGGWSVEELELFGRHRTCEPVALGPRILRAETAAIAALTLWQSYKGDWRLAPPPRKITDG
jgi:16S rRNA (uracil1498-N3)-methyltransferase